MTLEEFLDKPGPYYPDQEQETIFIHVHYSSNITGVYHRGHDLDVEENILEAYELVEQLNRNNWKCVNIAYNRDFSTIIMTKEGQRS